jgi:hypothetical protein
VTLRRADADAELAQARSGRVEEVPQQPRDPELAERPDEVGQVPRDQRLGADQQEVLLGPVLFLLEQLLAFDALELDRHSANVGPTVRAIRPVASERARIREADPRGVGRLLGEHAHAQLCGEVGLDDEPRPHAAVVFGVRLAHERAGRPSLDTRLAHRQQIADQLVLVR